MFAVFLLLCVAGLCLLAATTGSGLEQPAGLQWWQRGQDQWHYKDDWNAKYLTGATRYEQTYELPGPVRRAAMWVWAAQPYTLRLNGIMIGRDADSGTIETYDLTGLLPQGPCRFEIDGSEEVILEGVAILADGSEFHFRTDAAWNGGRVVTRDERTGGPRDYGGDTHMARMLDLSAEQRAKGLVNRVNAARRRILDRDLFRFWQNRDPREVLDLSAPTAPRRKWAQIEQFLEQARPIAAQAGEHILRGRFDAVEAAIAPAIEMTARAEALLGELTGELEQRNAARRAALGLAAGDGGTFNESLLNRLGWIAGTEPLDNDPLYWEFDVAPACDAALGLAGLWDFRLDPAQEGVPAGWAEPGPQQGWQTLYAPCKWGWERLGITQANPHHVPRGAWSKPYNGCAWYRKELEIPAAWAGQDLVLELGPRWSNEDWLAVNGQFLQSPQGPGSRQASITIPAGRVRFGQRNTLALRVFNDTNIGGIVNPGLRLSPAGAVPANRRSLCGPASVRELRHGGAATQVNFSSALSPAVVVATDGETLCLRGWTARGYADPTRWATARNGQARSEPLPAGELGALGENWLLLWCPRQGDRATRPVLVVFGQRPEAITVGDDGFGGRRVELRFARGGPRVALVRPFDEPPGEELTAEQVQRCRLWAAALLRYPVGYAEHLDFTDDRYGARLRYEYLELENDWAAQPLALAPAPMLFSYALEHAWPDAEVEAELTDLGCCARSGYYPQMDCGPYRAVRGADEMAYSYARCEPARMMYGAGTLGEELEGPQMYARLVEWGFNSCRTQIEFHGQRGWASFLQTPDGRPEWNETSRVDFDGQARRQLEQVLAWHRERDLTAILNWFWDSGRSELPAWRQEQMIELWRLIAQRCRSLPPGAVWYSVLNEPSGLPWDVYQPFVERLAATIRQADPVHTITLEPGNGWGQTEDLDMFRPTGDPNTVYQFHVYGPHTQDCHRYDLHYPRYQLDEDRFHCFAAWEERVLSAIRFAIRHQAQVFHGEFGVSFLGPDDAPRRWLETVLQVNRKYRIHWNWWNYSGNNIHRTGLIAGHRANPLVETLSRYARLGRPGRPLRGRTVEQENDWLPRP